MMVASGMAHLWLVICLIAGCWLGYMEAIPVIEGQRQQQQVEYAELLDDMDSQLSIFPTDIDETASLTGMKVVFSDFCINVRDSVIADIKQSTVSLATNIFSTLYYGVEPSGQVRPRPVSPPEVEQAPEQTEDQKSSTESTQTGVEPTSKRSIFGSFINVLSKTGGYVASSALNALKSTVGLVSITDAISDACKRVNEYNSNIQSQFDKVKDDLRQNMPEAYPELSTVDRTSLGCITVGRIARIANLCRMVQYVKIPISG